MAAPGAAMTVPQARAKFSPERSQEWHTQPICECGDYVSQHSRSKPFPCLICHHRPARKCPGYRYSRMGDGAPE